MDKENSFTIQRAMQNFRGSLAAEKFSIDDPLVDEITDLLVLGYRDFTEPTEPLVETDQLTEIALFTSIRNLLELEYSRKLSDLREHEPPDALLRYFPTFSNLLHFSEAELKKLVGGKGLGLGKLHFAEDGLAPAGFVLTDILGLLLKKKNYKEDFSPELWLLIKEEITNLEKRNDNSKRPKELRHTKFGDDEKPFLLAVRSGAPFSMPGAMSTVLNVGINDRSVKALAEMIGDEAAWDSYYNFMTSFITAVHDISSKKMDEYLAQKKAESENSLSGVELIKKQVAWLQTLAEVPQDPFSQLEAAIMAVYRSYDSSRAIKHRRTHGIRGIGSHTAVNIMPALYSNSTKLGYGGSGVMFSHNLQTGELTPVIGFAEYSQGFKVVGAEAEEGEVRSGVARKYEEELKDLVDQLKPHYLQSADIEFVIEGGELWPIQLREGDPSPEARIQIAANLWRKIFSLEEEGMDFDKIPKKKINKFGEEITEFSKKSIENLLFKMIRPSDINLLKGSFSSRDEDLARQEGRQLAKGKGIGAGVMVGKLTTSINRARKLLEAGETVVLFKTKIDPNPLTPLYREYGDRLAVVTLKVTQWSHVASVIQGRGGIGVTGIGEKSLTIEEGVVINNGEIIREGEYVSVNASNGMVYSGEIKIVRTKLKGVADSLVQARRELGMSLWLEAEDYTNLLSSDEYRENKNRLSEVKRSNEKEGWSSEKSKGQRMMNAIFPREYLNYYHVMKLNDIEKIQKQVLEGLRGVKNKQTGEVEKYQVTIRSAFTQTGEEGMLGKNPWVMFNPMNDGEKEKEAVEAFFNGDMESFTKNGGRVSEKYGLFPQWIEEVKQQEGIEFKEVLVGFNKPGKLEEENADQHFVMGLQLPMGSGEAVVKALIIQKTAQLRTLEGEGDYNQKDVVDFEIFMRKGTKDGIGRFNFGVGANHIDDQKLEQLIEKLNNQEDLNPYEDLVYEEIIFKLQLDKKDKIGLKDVPVDQVRKTLLEFIMEKDMPWETLKGLLEVKSLTLITEVENKLREMWPTITSSMAAMENHTGSPLTLEMQGRIGEKDTDPLKWFLIYGIKGLEEALGDQD